MTSTVASVGPYRLWSCASGSCSRNLATLVGGSASPLTNTLLSALQADPSTSCTKNKHIWFLQDQLDGKEP